MHAWQCVLLTDALTFKLAQDGLSALAGASLLVGVEAWVLLSIIV